MPVMNFESTLPMGAAELVRASAFRRSLDEDSRSDDDRITSRLSALDPSLHQDLLRFEQKGRQSELLDQALRARGFAVRFDRAPGVGHEGRLVERFAAEVVRRAAVAVAPEHPARVTFRSVRAEDTSTYGVRLERAGASDAFVDLEGKDGRVVVHAASGVRAVVLKPGALGVASGAPVEKSGPDTVPVRWE